MTQKSSTSTVLVVDDDDAIRDLVAMVLADAGYTVRTAADGAAAVALARATKPALILMDVNLPRLDGLSACRALRDDARTAKLPITIMSSMPVQDQQLRACRADRFLAKPFDIDRLLGEVAHYVAPDIASAPR
jgi:CheY-like chemotaxis protein